VALNAFLPWIAWLAGIAGVVLSIVAIVVRLVGAFGLGGIQPGTLLLANMAATPRPCLGYLVSVVEHCWGQA